MALEGFAELSGPLAGILGGTVALPTGSVQIGMIRRTTEDVAGIFPTFSGLPTVFMGTLDDDPVTNGRVFIQMEPGFNEPDLKDDMSMSSGEFFDIIVTGGRLPYTADAAGTQGFDSIAPFTVTSTEPVESGKMKFTASGPYGSESYNIGDSISRKAWSIIDLPDFGPVFQNAMTLVTDAQIRNIESGTILSEIILQVNAESPNVSSQIVTYYAGTEDFHISWQITHPSGTFVATGTRVQFDAATFGPGEGTITVSGLYDNTDTINLTVLPPPT